MRRVLLRWSRALLGAYRSYDVGDVRDGCSAGSAQVEDLGARLDVDLVNTAEDGRSQLGSERIPYSVLDLFAIFSLLGLKSEAKHLLQVGKDGDEW